MIYKQALFSEAGNLFIFSVENVNLDIDNEKSLKDLLVDSDILLKPDNVGF